MAIDRTYSFRGPFADFTGCTILMCFRHIIAWVDPGTDWLHGSNPIIQDASNLEDLRSDLYLLHLSVTLAVFKALYFLLQSSWYNEVGEHQFPDHHEKSLVPNHNFTIGFIWLWERKCLEFSLLHSHLKQHSKF